jgi:LysM repeat protein
MKKISLWFLILVFTASLVRAEDAATQQQLDKLSGQVQDLLDAQAQQGKRLDAMEKEIGDLREKISTPAVNDSASRDDLKKLAEQVQEIDKKRQDDNEHVSQTLEKLGKLVAGAPVKNKSTPSAPKQTGDTTAPSFPQTGHSYEVQPGDSLGAIIKAYRDHGVKVTKAQIIAANPKMNPEVLIPKQKIFIPDANAK